MVLGFGVQPKIYRGSKQISNLIFWDYMSYTKYLPCKSWTWTDVGKNEVYGIRDYPKLHIGRLYPPAVVSW